MSEPGSLPGSEAHHRSPEEERRVTAIRSLGLLDRSGDPVLTGLTRMASYVTGAEIAAVHFVDEDFVHRVAAIGAPLVTTPVDASICRHVVAGQTPLVVPDATLDDRFAGLVSADSPDDPVRFYAAVPLRVADGSVVGTLCTFDRRARELDGGQVELLEELADVARSHVELIRVASDLQEAATHDQLTGAVNRTMLHDRLAKALARRPRRGTGVTVAVIDVDHFKQVNDTLGHERGDDVLCWIVGCLKEAVREEDTVARLGGDEFAIVGEVSGGPERLRERLTEAFAVEGAPVTVSIGAVLANLDDDVKSALARADEAMYAAKSSREPGAS